MNFIGVDLHKKTIMVRVVDKDRKVICRRRPAGEEMEIRRFFATHTHVQVVVAAIAGDERFVQRVEPPAGHVVLAHPKRVRIIAESTRKSDKSDATVSVEFLALDMIPPACRPMPRQRAHRVPVRQRVYVQRRITAIKNEIRRIATNGNADRENLFPRQHQPCTWRTAKWTRSTDAEGEGNMQQTSARIPCTAGLTRRLSQTGTSRNDGLERPSCGAIRRRLRNSADCL